MIDLKQNTILREIPSNLLVDPRVERMAQSLQQSADAMLEWVDKINYRNNLDELPVEIIEHLIWESHITWSEGLALASTREQKINLISQSVELHRLKGTPAAIELVCSLLNVNTRLKEWFDYEGEPYHFRIDVMEVTENGLTEDTISLLEELVLEYKNARSFLEAINIYLSSRAQTYIGIGSIFGEEITVYPYTATNISVSGTYYMSMGHTEIESTTVYPKEDDI